MTVAALPPPPRPWLRLRPAPAVDGPYDDEVAESGQAMPGNLSLAFPPPTRSSLPLRLVPPAAPDAGPAPGGPPTPTHALPDPRGWTARLSQAIAEVLAGARSPSQLGRFATLDVLSLLERNAGRLDAHGGRPARRPVVASVHVSEPRDGVAEACAVVDTGARKRALALRLEGVDGRWRCTALQVG